MGKFWLCRICARADELSGCMKFLPGSHKESIVAHVDTFNDNNLLSRGQEIAVEVNETKGVALELMPGKAYGHFTSAGKPNERLNKKDFELCKHDSKIKRLVLYDGVDATKGKRY